MDILPFGQANDPSEGPAVYSFKSWSGEAGGSGRMMDKQCVIIVNQALQRNMDTYWAFWMLAFLGWQWRHHLLMSNTASARLL